MRRLFQSRAHARHGGYGALWNELWSPGPTAVNSLQILLVGAPCFFFFFLWRDGRKKIKSRFFSTDKNRDDDGDRDDNDVVINVWPKLEVIDLVENEGSNDMNSTSTPVAVSNDHKSNEEKEKYSHVEKQVSAEGDKPQGDMKKENPFAQFAFSSKTIASPKRQASITSYFTSSPDTSHNRKTKKARTFQAGGTTWVKLRDLDNNEQERIVTKWHSLVDPDGSLEERRFQVLVAARLHARCQEPTVRKAMQALREHFQPFNVESIAAATQDDISACISNLQYFNTKARHLISAANEIRTIHNGIVPEEEETLLKLKGIGPVMADLLGFVNTRAMHQKRRQRR